MCGALFLETFVSDNDGKFYVFVLATADEMDTLKGNIKLILNNQELMVKSRTKPCLKTPGLTVSVGLWMGMQFFQTISRP